MVRDKTRTLASPPLPRLVGPSQGCKLHEAPIRTLTHASGPLVWALGRFQPTANPPFRAFRGCGILRRDPMTRAHELVSLQLAMFACELAEHFRLRERMRQGTTVRRQGTDCCS